MLDAMELEPIDKASSSALKELIFRGIWVAQWVKAPAFGSGHDLRVLGSSPTLGSLLSKEAASPLSLPASLPTCDLSMSNK